MIVNKHFKKELTYNTVSITLVLLVTLILYAFIRYVKYIIEGKIPMGYIFELIGLELPNTLGLLLCAGLSLGLIVTISRMHAQKELIIWLTSGVSIKKMLLIFLRHILLFCFIIGILSMWLAPHSLTRLHHIKSKLSSSILSSFIVPGQFSKLGQTNQVLFAEDNKKDNTVSVFVADIDKNKLNTIITAKSIKVEEKKDIAILNINKGNLYNFKDNALINISFDTIEKGLPLLGDNSMSLIKSQSFYQLFINNKLSKNERFAEIHWRISQPICAFLLAFIAFGLAISFGKNKYYLILPSMLLFMVYYNLLMLSRHLTQTGQIHHLIGSMWVHIIFLALAFLLNIKKYKYAR